MLSQAGYLAVPNMFTASHLADVSSAIYGGLFFTLSIGAGLTVISFIIAFMWVFIFRKKVFYLKLFIFFQLMSILLLNLKGINIFPTLYVLLIPPTVFGLTVRLAIIPTQKYCLKFHLLSHAISLLILAFLWGTQMSDKMFINVRDTLLLSNPVGLKLNTFYYDYTLHAAETFRPVGNKLVKTYRLHHLNNPLLERSLHLVLLKNDYCAVQTGQTVDLDISIDGQDLIFSHQNKHILDIPANRFLSDYNEVLSDISNKCDKNRFFRFLTIICLLIGLPLMLYAIVFLALFSFLCLFFPSKVSTVIVSVTGVFIGAMILLPVYIIGQISPEYNDISTYLKSDSHYKRIQALKEINDDQLNLTAFDGYKDILSGHCVPELYWAVRALGKCRTEAAYNILIMFLDSKDINIVCMAFYSLGVMKNKRAIEEIIDRIKRSDNWYQQWYAYNALRSLKWRQTGLN